MSINIKIWICCTICILFLSYGFLYAEHVGGDVQVTCERGLRIYLDDDFVGVSNADEDGKYISNIPAGEHTVRVEKTGYRPETFRITIVSKKIIELKVGKLQPEIKVTQSGEADEGVLKKKVGSLRVLSAPISCGIEFMGSNYSKSKPEMLFEDIPIGAYPIKFTKGNKTLTYDVKIEQDITKELKVDFLNREVIDLTAIKLEEERALRNKKQQQEERLAQIEKFERCIEEKQKMLYEEYDEKVFWGKSFCRVPEEDYDIKWKKLGEPSDYIHFLDDEITIEHPSGYARVIRVNHYFKVVGKGGISTSQTSFWGRKIKKDFKYKISCGNESAVIELNNYVGSGKGSAGKCNKWISKEGIQIQVFHHRRVEGGHHVWELRVRFTKQAFLDKAERLCEKDLDVDVLKELSKFRRGGV